MKKKLTWKQKSSTSCNFVPSGKHCQIKRKNIIQTNQRKPIFTTTSKCMVHVQRWFDPVGVHCEGSEALCVNLSYTIRTETDSCSACFQALSQVSSHLQIVASYVHYIYVYCIIKKPCFLSCSMPGQNFCRPFLVLIKIYNNEK